MLANTIVAGNTAAGSGPDISGTIDSQGGNLIGIKDGSAGGDSTDISGTAASPLSAQLGTLASNGGPTLTMLPLAGSPAIDHGHNSSIPSQISIDQRNLARIAGSSVDTGAVESGAAALPHLTGQPGDFFADLSDDWSNASNPNTGAFGTWSYNQATTPLPRVDQWVSSPTAVIGGWAPSANQTGDFLPFWFQTTPNEIQQANFLDDVPGDVVVHTTDQFNGGGNGTANITWTSPVSGAATVSGILWSPSLQFQGSRQNDYTLIANPGPNAQILSQGIIPQDSTATRATPVNFSIPNLSITAGETMVLSIFPDASSAAGYFTGVDLGIDVAQAAPAPTASLVRANAITAAAATEDITVAFSDTAALDAASINGDEILVTGPGGFSSTASLVSSSLSSDGKSRHRGLSRRRARRIVQLSPANGTYTVTLQGASLTAGGTGNAAGLLGTFTVALPAPPPAPVIGGLDPTFGGGDGVATSTITGATVTTVDSLTLADGSELSAGYDTAGNFTILKFRPDGSVDSSFGTGGRASVNFRGTTDIAAALSVQRDGKIVIAGYSLSGDGVTADIALARFNSAGALDASFGASGKVLLDIGSTGTALSEAKGLAIAANGSIYVGGFTQTPAKQDAVVVRFKSSGALDLSYGSRGVVTVDFLGHADEFSAVALQKDGKLIAAGSATNAAGHREIAAVRLTIAGKLDTTFAAKGKYLRTLGGSEDSVRALAIQTDGKILLGGTHGIGDPTSGNLTSSLLLLRLTAAGKTDAFGRGGAVITAIPGATLASINRILIKTNGQILVSGATARTLAGVAGGQIGSALVEYTAQGAPVTTFGQHGILTVFAPAPSSPAAPLAPTDSQFEQFVASGQGIIAMVPGGDVRALASQAVDSNATQVSIAAVVVTGVDLKTSLAAAPSAIPKNGAPVSVRVANLGDTAANGLADIQIFASADQAFDSSDKLLLHTSKKISLTANSASVIKLVVNSAKVGHASEFLIATVVFKGKPTDRNTSNNTAFSQKTVKFA